jgi:protein-tyrosine phosphatase
MKTILFLCTGNYYRSRFAEIYFNHIASLHKLCWRAQSRALALELGACNVGPVSLHTAKRLGELCISSLDTERFPMPATRQDFSSADMVVAINEAEHMQYIERSFKEFSPRVTYWAVPDLGEWDSSKALDLIKSQVDKLADSLL